MATQPEPQSEQRLPLSRERVLHAALALADEAGIASLSMRRLGQALGVEAMSLYNHVANKDDLLDGIVELVASEIELPSDAVDWKEGLRQTAISSHEVFLRHRWACSLMMRPRASPARMRWMEAVLRTLRQAGFSADMTHHAYHALDSHITGFTLWLVSMPFASKEELVDMAEGFLREIPPRRVPLRDRARRAARRAIQPRRADGVRVRARADPRRARAAPRPGLSSRYPRPLATRKPMCAWRRTGRLWLRIVQRAHRRPGLANERPRRTRSPGGYSVDVHSQTLPAWSRSPEGLTPSERCRPAPASHASSRPRRWHGPRPRRFPRDTCARRYRGLPSPTPPRPAAGHRPRCRRQTPRASRRR